MSNEGRFLRTATMNDLNLLFGWANDPDVRNNSFCTKEITLEEHTAWYTDVMEREDIAIYIMVCGGADVGQVRIHIVNDEAEISYSIAREYRGMGYGKEMISLLLQKVNSDFPQITRLTAQVKPDNAQSCKIFSESGYHKKAIVYEMELRK